VPNLGALTRFNGLSVKKREKHKEKGRIGGLGEFVVKLSSREINPGVFRRDERVVLAVGGISLIMTRAEALFVAGALADVIAQLPPPTPGKK
jgi:hypothetical protein